MEYYTNTNERGGSWEYTGMMVNGKPHGCGKFTVHLSTGLTYSYLGNWVEGCKEGPFMIEIPKYNKLISKIYKNDEPIDRSHTIYYTDQSGKYVGDVVRFNATGNGVYTDSCRKYEGEFLNDKFHGYGVLTYHDYMPRIEGHFEHGECVGFCKIYTDDAYHEGIYGVDFVINNGNLHVIKKRKSDEVDTSSSKRIRIS